MINRWKRKQRSDTTTNQKYPPGVKVITADPPFAKTEEERADMTISCRDSDYIPKVKNAGSYMTKNGQKVQIMHNGVLVKKGGYYGEWMERIIRELKGHHEPQEEKIFFELLKKLKNGATMIELGSFWAYYSLWFNKEIKNATNICCEPDPNNMEIGKLNAKLNEAKPIFIDAAAGDVQGEFIEFPLESNPGELRKVPIVPVDEIMKKENLKRLDILHMDVQGSELAAIRGAQETIQAGKLRFLIVSTHHFSISGDPLTHFKCLELIKSLGGHIIANHSIPESFSGDGLIAASFDEADRDLTLHISLNSSSDSLYRPYEADLAILLENYEKLRRKLQLESVE